MIGSDALLLLASHAVRVGVLVVMGLVVCRMLRGYRARTRAVVWSLVAVGCLVAPLLQTIVPRVPLFVGTNRVESPPTFGVSEAPAVMRGAPLPPSAPRSNQPWARVPAIDGVSWPTFTMMAWLGLAGVFVARDLGSLLQVRNRSRRASNHVPAVGRRRLQALAGIRGSMVRLAVTDALPAPSTHGWRRPTILVPTWCGTWLAQRWDAVLAHEMAHVRSGDWFVRLTARLVLALNWFNPFVWLLFRRLVAEQERAADEAVLEAGARASDYAAHLVALAHHRSGSGRIGSETLAAMAAPHRMEDRIMRILNHVPRRSLVPVAVVPGLLMCLALTGAVAAVHPTTEPQVTPAPEDLRSTILRIQETERRYEPQLEAVERAAEVVEAQAAAVEAQAVIHEETMADVEAVMARHEARIAEMEAEMAPILERIEARHREMGGVDDALRAMEAAVEPLEAELAAVERRLEPLVEELAELHRDEVGEARRLELEAQIEVIHESMAPVLARIDEVMMSMEPEIERLTSIEVDVEPEIAALEAIHERYAVDMEALAEVDIDIDHEAMERFHDAMEPLQEELAAHHHALDGFQREMDVLMDELKPQLRSEIERRLRIHLGRLADGGTSFGDAADAIADGASITVDESGLTFSRSRGAVEAILREHVIGSGEQLSTAMDEAIDQALDAVCSFRLEV
jgi:beta-lactamase regulating signal transducer with metallopeptidase domain/predicted  nucleic acid-binding Zn-ribbon protein